MRVKLDENLPASALAVAQDLGHDDDTVVIEGLAGEDDDVVLAAAAADGRFSLPSIVGSPTCGSTRPDLIPA